MKDQYIKFRVTEEEKANLMRLAMKENKTLSGYLLQRGLAEKSGMENFPLSEEVEILDLLNEINHQLKKCSDEKLKADIQMFCEMKAKSIREAKK